MKGVSGVDKYLVSLKFNDEELKSIMEDLTEAQETIWKCYGRLKELGVIEICKGEAASGN